MVYHHHLYQSVSVMNRCNFSFVCQRQKTLSVNGLALSDVCEGGAVVCQGEKSYAMSLLKQLLIPINLRRVIGLFLNCMETADISQQWCLSKFTLSSQKIRWVSFQCSCLLITKAVGSRADCTETGFHTIDLCLPKQKSSSWPTVHCRQTYRLGQRVCVG